MADLRPSLKDVAALGRGLSPHGQAGSAPPRGSAGAQLLGRHRHSPPQCPVLSPSFAPPPLQLTLPSPAPVIWVGRGGSLRVAPAPEMSTCVATAGPTVASLRTEPSAPTSGALPFPVPMGGQPPAMHEHRQSSGFILRRSPDRCKRFPLSCRQGTASRQTPPVYRGSTSTPKTEGNSDFPVAFVWTPQPLALRGAGVLG